MNKTIAAFSFAAVGICAATASMSGVADHGRRSTDPPVPNRGKLGQDLFIALDRGDVNGVKALLKQGADPNARNGLEFTPMYMAAATHQTNMMQILLDAGGSNSTQTTYGTPLSFAALSGNVEGAQLLLSEHVKPDVARTDGKTPLMLAANVGCTPIVQALIASHVDVNAQDDGGYSALSQTARSGFPGTAKVLIGAGADVNAADVLGQTPLMLAAMNGQTDMVKLLLAHKAHPNATDNQGHTALWLALKYSDSPAVVQALKQAGAHASFSGSGGQVSSRAAIRRSLAAIQASMSNFSDEANCVSCHHDGLGRIAMAEATSHGYRVDSKLEKVENARVGGMVSAMLPLHTAALKSPEALKQIPLIEMNEVSDAYCWFMSGMAAQGQPRSAATEAMAMCLATQQSPDGSWTFALPRVPMQSSYFTFTALAVHDLQAYGPHDAEIAGRVDKARDWLLKAQPRNSEDRASRLMGLYWSGVADRGSAVAAILADQRPDGGWSQVPGGHSDAYATGQALYVLRVGGGVKSSSAAWRRGKEYLLRTQDSDGTWFVNKRALPANNYFSTGFPHGESQYASFNGTCWAMMALLQAG